MKPHAIEQALERLDMAQAKYDSLHHGMGYKAFKPIWSEFLLALNACFSKLEQGAKGCGKSEGWFGRVKHLRRNDPLLSYLHQARNSDEHGIAPITRTTPSSVSYEPPPGVSIASFGTDDDGNFWASPNPDGSAPRGIVVGIGRIHLVEVTDTRYHDRYPVPREHLGSPIPQQIKHDPEPGPMDVANLGLAYVRGLIDEARGLKPH